MQTFLSCVDSGLDSCFFFLQTTDHGVRVGLKSGIKFYMIHENREKIFSKYSSPEQHGHFTNVDIKASIFCVDSRLIKS